MTAWFGLSLRVTVTHEKKAAAYPERIAAAGAA